MNAALRSDPIASYIVRNEVFICVDIINGQSSRFDARLVLGE